MVNFSRDVVVENTLTFAVEQCLAGGEPGTLEGDGASGRFLWHDGAGNHATVVWSPIGVVALGFDHEGCSGEPTEQFSVAVPSELGALVREAHEAHASQATCAVWATPKASSEERLPVSENLGIVKNDAGVEALDRILGGRSSDASLARRLAQRRLRGPYDLTEEEGDEILGAERMLASPTSATLIDAAAVRRVAAELQKLGVRWKGAAARVRAINAIIEAAQARTSSQRAAADAQLLAATATGDVEGVRRALDAGAALECRTMPGEFGHPCALTALELAVYFHDDAIAKLLLARGANGAGNPEVSSLLTAVQREHRSLVGTLVLSGAPLTHRGRTVLQNASDLKDLEILRLFVACGPPPTPDKRLKLTKAVEAAGDSDLLQRVNAWADPPGNSDEIRRAHAARLALDETPPPADSEKRCPPPRRPVAMGLSEADRSLFNSAAAGDLPGVKQALANGARLDKPLWRDELPPWQEGATALIVAMLNANHEVAQHLIEAGADVHAWIVQGRGKATPLVFAVGQGDAELVRLLLSRGATDRDGSMLAPLQHVPLSSPPAAIAAALEVVRMMLDAGAALPNDAACFALATLAQTAGATDLLPRLENSWAPDAVLEVPPPIDTVANAPAVSALLERAAQVRTNPTEVLAYLTEAWRKSLHPRIADVAEALAQSVAGPIPCVDALVSLAERCQASRPPLVRNYPAAEASHVVEALRALEASRADPMDPRATRLLMRWLWDGESHPVDGSAMARCEDAVAALLVDLRDVRFVQSLEQRCRLRRPIKLQPARASLRTALAVMKQVRPEPLGDVDLKHLAAIEDGLASRRHVPKLPTILDLYAAVYEAPDDDEPRRLLADRLMEVDDAHGELIALQLAQASGSSCLGLEPNPKREAELLREHGRRWLGEIAPIVGPEAVFERGFVVQAAVDGDGAATTVFASGLGTQREWSTMRRLSLRGRSSISTMLDGQRLSGLRELVDAPVDAFESMLAHAWPKLERLEQGLPRRTLSLEKIRVETLRDATPSLRSLRVGLQTNSTAGVVRILDLWPSLKSLAVPLWTPIFGELVALAIERGLEDLTVLGCLLDSSGSYLRPAGDLRFQPHRSQVEISFPADLLPEFVEAAAGWVLAMGGPHLKSVVLLPPVGGKAKVPKKGCPSFSKGRKSVDLTAIYSAAEALGVPCSVGSAEQPWFGDWPGRNE